MRGWSLRTVHILLVAVVLGSGLSVIAVTSPTPSGATSARDYKPDSQECRMLALINNYRRKHNEDKLELSARLGAASEHHSKDMARKRKMYHSDLRKNAEQHGYDGGSLGENVGYRQGTGSAKPMFNSDNNSWIKSADHRRNILDGGFRAIGIARAKAGDTYYWTTIFGSERDQEARC